MKYCEFIGITRKDHFNIILEFSRWGNICYSFWDSTRPFSRGISDFRSTCECFVNLYFRSIFYGLTEKDSKNAKNKLNQKDRKKVFLDYIRAQDQSTKSAMAKYPKNIDKQINYQKTLESTNRERIKKKYNITENKLVAIKAEGVKKKWEFY